MDRTRTYLRRNARGLLILFVALAVLLTGWALFGPYYRPVAAVLAVLSLYGAWVQYRFVRHAEPPPEP